MIKPINFKQINLNSKYSKPLSLQERVSKMVNDFKEKIQSQELDSYYYEAINENIQNLEKEMLIVRKISSETLECDAISSLIPLQTFGILLSIFVNKM